MQAGTIKCPKCGMMLAIKDPNAAVRRGAPPAAASAPPADPFAGLPAFQRSGSPPPRGRAQVGLPPAKPPPRIEPPPKPKPSRRSQPRTTQRGNTTRRGKKSGGSNPFATVLSVFGGLALTGLLLCGGAVGAFAIFGPRHSGWEEQTIRGYTVKMPPGKQLKQRSTKVPWSTVHETIYRRRESGSQYILMVSDSLPPELRGTDIQELLRTSQVGIGGLEPVTRSGVSGIHGTMQTGELQGAEAEYFLHNGKMVVLVYAAYSEFKDRIGGKMRPRVNESDLDKPDEFFESLKFP